MKKNGFTLAEVLITIGIIGVVAALTIPALISNYQKRVLASQFKETYAILTQGFRLILADDDADGLSGTSVWASVPEEGCTLGQNCDEEFIKGLRKHIKLDVADYDNTSYNVGYLNYSGSKELHVSAVLHNGAALLGAGALKNPKPSPCCGTYIFPFWVDINGVDKGPNVYGRDIFSMSMLENGELVPQYAVQSTINYCKNQNTMDYATCYENQVANNTWHNEVNSYYNCETKVSSFGYGCGGRIIDQGWTMSY